MASLKAALARLLRRVRAGSVNKLDFKATYTRHVAALKREHAVVKALELAVGGEFDAIGLLEADILRHFGLTADDDVIDVGCGSGRLAKPLAGWLRGHYLGIDVIPELVARAGDIAARPDWDFRVADGLVIPAADDSADIVCFFSVFTHLLHEQTFLYLRDARRVLRPGGRIVFSFLEFSMPSHWDIFAANVADVGVDANHLNMFFGRDAIHAWAAHLELEVVSIEDGDHAFIPLSQPVNFENGAVADGFAALGQSVCALRKPRDG